MTARMLPFLRKGKRVVAGVLGRADAPAPTVARPYDTAWEPADQPTPVFETLRSQACTRAQIDSDRFALRCTELEQRRLCHRKQWEWCYIIEALHQTGVLVEGARGLGFGVGTEPLASYLAARHCRITATDLPIEVGGHEAWADTDQHAESIERINEYGLCDPEVLRQLVEFRPVDMTDIPDDLVGYDFTWSSCALEHLGDLRAGMDFILRSMSCLRPGGVAVHTTEYNVSDRERTVATGPTVAYRRRDLEQVVAELQDLGHSVDVTFGLGDTPEDRHIDVLPFTNTHLKVMLEDHVITSFGLIVRRGDS